MNPDTSYISFPAFDEIAECVNVEPVDKIRSLLLEVMDNAAAASMRRNTLSDSIAVRDFIARSAVEKMRRHGLIK